MAVFGAGKRIQAEVSQWNDVTIGPHRFGGVEFALGKREFGHMHGDALVDVPLPKKMRNSLVSSGQAEPHYVLPQSGWVSVHLDEWRDIDRAIRILRQSYEFAQTQRARRAEQWSSVAS